jgi:trigger factor
MNIVQEQIDALNAVLKVQLKPDDYQPKVNDALKKYSKKVTMPGFRPGMVPVGLVKKMYGKSLLVEELNRIVADSVDQYISEKNIQVLGNPLPQQTGDDINWENPGDFEFSFEMGIAPEVKLTLPPAHTFTAYEIIVSDAQVQEEVDKLRRRYGNYTSPEVSDNDCSIYGNFQELDADGNVKEGGIANTAFLLISKVRDLDTRASFTGRKAGDTIDFDPQTALGTNEEIKYILGVQDGELTPGTRFRCTIERVNKVEPAELNQEMFDRIYGDGNVADEAAFLEKVRAELAEGFRYEGEHSLKHELEDELLKDTGLVLPDEFLKRWLKYSNEKITDEQLASDYKQYARDLKWRLIENKIFRDQNMEITEEEMENYARSFVMDQYVRYGQAHLLTEEKLDELAKRYLSNRESAQRVVESLSGRKVFEYLNQIITKDVKKVTHDEFTDIMSRHMQTHQH